MADTFKALVVDRRDGAQVAEFRDLSIKDLMPGNVLVRVTHSTINYKDGLALTGRGPIIRKFPMIPGIDFAGTVETSSDAGFKPGDDVILNGWGVGEGHFGGYAGYAQVPGDWLMKRPERLSLAETMAIGTAGYTAALALDALEDHQVTPDKGPVVVTGAAGGVGSVAVALLKAQGFAVTASTGRPEEGEFLKRIGASEVIARTELSGAARPLAKERWAGAVDVAGGTTLANVISMTKAEGTVTAMGLAQSMDLPITVAPFILRGVKLVGINSVTATAERRTRAWARLEKDLDRGILKSLTATKTLADLPSLAPQILEGKVRGRIVIEI